MKETLALLFLGFFILGCATVGKQIDMNQLARFKEGVTTEKEVIAALGNPDFKSLTSDGKTMMTYMYTEAKSKPENFIPIVGGVLVGGMSMKQRMIQFLFDKNSVMEKYIANESDQDISTGLMNAKRRNPPEGT